MNLVKLYLITLSIVTVLSIIACSEKKPIVEPYGTSPSSIIDVTDGENIIYK